MIHPLRQLWNRIQESLLVRLVVSISLLAMLTTGLAAGAAFYRARAALRTAILDRLMTVAFVKEGELNRWIEDQRTDLVFLSTVPALRSEAVALAAAPPDAAAAQRSRALATTVLESAAGRALDMDEVFLLSAVGGRVIASTNPARVGDYRVADLFFRIGAQRTYVQNVYPSPLSGRPTLTIATPMRDPTGRVIAVLAGHLNLGHMDSILAERTGLGKTGEAYLVTDLNDLLSSTRFGRSDAGRGVHSEGVRRALAGETDGGLYHNYAGVTVLGAYRWDAPRRLALMVEMHATEAFAPARSLFVTILLIGLAATGGATVGIYLIARRIARPILAVAHTAADIAAGDFAAVAPVTTRDEIGVLARTFNTMTARLREVHTDLTGQVAETGRAYHALEASQQLLQAVVDNTANLILVLDPSGRFLLVNRRFENLFHLRHSDVHGLEPVMVLPSETADAIRDATATVLKDGPPVERDVSLEVDGVMHHYHFVAFPLRQAGSAPFGVGVIGVDLSERTRAEEERRRLEAGVQQAQKLESLGLLAGGIAHDFNNILTAIVGGTALALQELGPGSPVRADLELVVASAERAAKLTRQMLAYAGRASFAIEIFDLNSVIREMAELIAVSVPKRAALTHELTNGIPGIRADRTQVSQVVLNLITNAAEATGDRGGRVVVRTSVRDKEDVVLARYRFVPTDAAAFVELVVEDNGGGMKPETLEKMFDPFYSTKGSGRGLGLAAVLGIVKQSGGTLRVTSTEGGGTTFAVLFPAATVRAETGPASRLAAELGKASGTVLLVDDEAIVRRAATKILERAGYSVLAAKDGREAVDLFRTEGRRIDAVILDVTMPVMGGAEAFTRMREIGPVVPVIVSSGYDQQDTVSAFTGDGVDFLQKPYRPDQLLARLRKLMAPPEGRRNRS